MAEQSPAKRKSSAERTLPTSFYERDTLRVSRELLGKLLVVESPRSAPAIARIVETEAYMADDPASHSARGQTPRARIMFGPPGRAYVYFIYGNYEMLNFVTEPAGRAGAVLIRAVEPVSGEDAMWRRRYGARVGARTPVGRRGVTNGPGKLCRALGIRMSHNGQSLQGPALKVVDDGFKPARISVSPRVGIRQAIDKPWRYFVEGNEFVSRAPQNAMAKPWRARGGAS